MRNNDKAIIIGSVLFGLFIIGLGNIEQYENTSEYFGMGGLISIVWAWAYYLTIREEK